MEKCKMDNYYDKEIALSLTDLALFYRPDSENYKAFLRGTECRRFYIGSYFCGKYFLKSTNIFLTEMASFMDDEGFRLTLTVPSAQGHLATAVKNSLARTLQEYGGLIDEVVVNDYGTLRFLHQIREWEHGAWSVTAGRLFFRGYRDPRYPEKMGQVSRVVFPSLLENETDAVEFDVTSRQMDLSELPESMPVHVHYPYAYVTYSPVCEYASVRQPTERKFRISLPCGLSCMQAMMETESAGATFVHVGKGVYTECSADAGFSREPDRFIYWPLREFFDADWDVRVTR